MQHWQGTVLICQPELCFGMNILQPLTIHTSIQIRPLVATRKLIQMYVLQAQSALPRPLGRRFSSRANHCYSLPVNRSCTQVVTFPYGRRSFCSGTVPEGKAEGGLSKRRKRPKPAKQIRKWALCMFPLGVVQLVSPLCLSEGLFVLIDSSLDACAGGRWFIQLWMLARFTWFTCVVVWGSTTTG